MALSAATSLAMISSFPANHPISERPYRLSESNGVKHRYWKAVRGELPIFLPGWSVQGAVYINLTHFLAREHQVIVFDQRRYGLSQAFYYSTRISCFPIEPREFTNQVAVEKADFCCWSIGWSVHWGH